MIKEYGYEYNAVIDQKLKESTQGKSVDDSLWGGFCFRSGRDALKAIAREYPGVDVFLPSLCCDSMITPFEHYGCKIKFYKLNRDLTVDFLSLLETVKKNVDIALLLFYDYFGVTMFTETQLRELKNINNKMLFIRDVTHTLLSFKEIKFDVNFTVSSLRKWLNVPDGGVLWTDVPLKRVDFYEDLEFSNKRLLAQSMRTEFFNSGNEDLKKNYRQLFSYVSKLLDKDGLPIKMSSYAHSMVQKVNFEEIKQRRHNNAHVLVNIFSHAEGIKLIQQEEYRSDLYVPILISNRDCVQSKLSGIGIFNTIIWPLREEQKKFCETARYITENMLAVPCDQRYDTEDMQYIGREIVRAVYEENNGARC